MPSHPNIHIRRVDQQTPTLLEHIYELHHGLIGDGSPPHLFRNYVTKRLDDENTLLILALDQEVPIGYGLASDVLEHPFMPEWQRAGYITQFYVTPAYRRRSIGRLMCDFMVEWLASRGVKTIQLNVEPDNSPGEQFWRSQGFAPHRIRMKRAIPDTV